MFEGRGFPGSGVVAGRALVLEMDGGADGGMAANAVGGVGCGVVEDCPRPAPAGILVASGAVACVMPGRAAALVARGAAGDVGVIKFCPGPAHARVLVAGGAVAAVVIGRAAAGMARSACRDPAVIEFGAFPRSEEHTSELQSR